MSRGAGSSQERLELASRMLSVFLVYFCMLDDIEEVLEALGQPLPSQPLPSAKASRKGLSSSELEMVDPVIIVELKGDWLWR